MKAILDQIVEIYDVEAMVTRFTYENSFQEWFHEIDDDNSSLFMFVEDEEYLKVTSV